MKKLTAVLTGLFFMANLSASAVAADEEVLCHKQQSIVAIASATASGSLDKLKVALGQGLEAGLTVNEIKEVLVQIYAYAGFPRSLNGINTFMGLMEEHRAAGIKDKEGPEATPLPEDWDRDAYGAKVRAKLQGQEQIPAPSGYQLFAPTIDAFLKQHLFADIFARDVLDYQSRELATISILSSIPGLAPQLKSHMNMAMNTGLSEVQMKAFIKVLGGSMGEQAAADAGAVLEGVLSARAGK